jgi:hypothetical protein
MRALAYLRWRLFKNGLLWLVLSPQRLIVALFFVAWAALGVFFLLVAAVAGQSAPALLHPSAEHVRLGVVVLLTLAALGAIERGLEGAVFSFPPADFDFLFPTPIPRRLVVASRVVLDGLVVTADVALVLLFAGPTLLRLAGREPSTKDLMALWFAATAYTVLAVNIGRIIELLLASGQLLLGASKGLLKGVVWGIAIGLLGLAVVAGLRGGEMAGGVLHVLSSPPLNLVFLPTLCVASVVTGDPLPFPGGPWAGVGLVATLALAAMGIVCLLDRDVVEATLEHSARVMRLREAARAQDLEQLAGERFREANPRQRSVLVGWHDPRLAQPYRVLAEMSHGSAWRWVGWALVLVAAGFAARVLPLSDEALRLIPGPAAAYLLLLVSSFQSLRFRSELGHVILLRSLPLATWQQVLGLTLPRALLQALFLMGCLASFWLGRPSVRPDLSLSVGLCLPLATVVTSLVGALVASLFPNASDLGQRFLGGLLHTLGVGLGLTPCGILVAVGTTLGLPALVTALLGNVGLLPVALVALWLATAALDRHQPGEE